MIFSTGSQPGTGLESVCADVVVVCPGVVVVSSGVTVVVVGLGVVVVAAVVVSVVDLAVADSAGGSGQFTPSQDNTTACPTPAHSGIFSRCTRNKRRPMLHASHHTSRKAVDAISRGEARRRA